MRPRITSTRLSHRLRAVVIGLALVIALPASSLGANGHPNPTAKYVALTAAVEAAGGVVVPLINSGQTLDGVTFEGIPDGLGAKPVGNGRRFVDIYVAFEQSHVPFGGFADFEDSSVQRARLDLRTMQLTKLDEVLPPTAGFIRFCSAFMAGPDEGFDEYTFFVNEESNDVIHVPAGAPYGADPALTPYRQAGYSVYLDTDDEGIYDEVASLGRHNHENTVIVPGGWGGVAALSGDDTFDAPSSQLYLHLSDSLEALKADDGMLYGFRVTATDEGDLDDPTDAFNGANDYHEINVGDAWSGEFILVPDDVARGTTGVAPQKALEDWSNANNVFQFIRVEDIAYDPDDPNVVYFADTGERRALPDSVWTTLDTRGGTVDRSATGRLHRGLDRVPATGTPEVWPADPNGVHARGRVFRMELNAADPRLVDSFSVVHDADTTMADGSTFMRNPDNLDVGTTSIMVQEDTSNAKIWQYTLSTGVWRIVAGVTHPTTPAAGESSGIIDMSQWIGAGWWALDVQSHVNLPGTQGPFTYTVPISGAQITYNTRREDGQLLLMYVPGS